MNFSKVQLQTLIGNHLKRENGLNEVLEMTLNALMKAERNEHLNGQTGNKANGFRPGRVYGKGKLLELRIPRDRNGNFYPKVLALLRAQQEETDRMVSALYGQGLTQAQVGQVFEELYGRHYSPSSVSRMIEWMRQEVSEWLERPLETYYPVVFIDAIHVKVRRQSVATEAFYVILGVTPERRREVLGIAHMPSESATGWRLQLQALRERGVENIGLVVADGIQGLDSALSSNFSGTPLQRCTVHIKRNLLARIRATDKPELAEDLRRVFRSDDPDDSPQAGWQRWQAMCGKWSSRYRSFKKLSSDQSYRNGFTYLQFDYRIRSMIYTTNWIERLNRDFRRVLRMRTSMPGENSVIVLLGNVAMNQKAYARRLPKMNYDKKLFPNDQLQMKH